MAYLADVSKSLTCLKKDMLRVQSLTHWVDLPMMPVAPASLLQMLQYPRDLWVLDMLTQEPAART